MALLVLVGLMLAVGLPPGPGQRARMRWAMAGVLAFTGTDHLMNPWRYLPMMPEAVPMPRQIVLFTGLCEIFGGLGLLLPATRRLAGMLLALFFLCVLPANINAAVHGIQIPGLEGPAWAYWARIPFQAVVVWWALYASGVVRWPATSPAAASPAASGAPRPG